MTARRITGRAATMATITVLFAGAAAAAAGGVLPSPFSDSTAGITTLDSTDPSVTDPTSTDPATSGPLVTDPVGSEVPGTEVDTTSSLPEAYGLCTAWHAGHEKKDNPGFAKLQHAADEANGTVDDYCDQVFADKDASRGDTDGDTDDTDDTDDDDTDDSTAPAGERGQSGHSQGNGNGHGHNG